jgi:predicted AAA+ superfamily ATPase
VDETISLEVHFKIKHLLENEYLIWGGYPEIVLEEENLCYEILKNYYEMIVFRDIVDRFSVRNTKFLRFLLKYLFTNAANLFSVNKFYRSLKGEWRPSRETLLDYLSYILETETIFLIPKFSYALKIQEKNPKKFTLLITD